MFPASPLKFRTSGFPQYGFKQDIQLQPSLNRIIFKCKTHIQIFLFNLYVILASISHSSFAYFFSAVYFGLRHTYKSCPETLCFLLGYVVPIGLTLLWSHPNIFSPPVDLLYFDQQVFAIRSCIGWEQDALQFNLHNFIYVSPSVPR